MTNALLEVHGLRVSTQGKEILHGVDLTIGHGEMVALMGPNGSGKSTLANVLAGHPHYDVTGGDIVFDKENLLSMVPEVRAQKGVFLAFQEPIEIPGLPNISFLKSGFNAIRKARGLTLLDAMDFRALVKNKLKLLDMDEDFLYRNLNEGFSGGEKKRNELLQMALLEPKLAILDELDSGVDREAMKMVVRGVKQLHQQGCSILVITHYQHFLEAVDPDRIFVFSDGKIKMQEADTHGEQNVI